VLTGDRMGVNCPLWPAATPPSCRKLEFRLSALMDSDLAWVKGKSGRQSWRYADALQRSIISEAIYHFIYHLLRAAQLNMLRATITAYSFALNLIQQSIWKTWQEKWWRFTAASKLMFSIVRSRLHGQVSRAAIGCSASRWTLRHYELWGLAQLLLLCEGLYSLCAILESLVGGFNVHNRIRHTPYIGTV